MYQSPVPSPSHSPTPSPKPQPTPHTPQQAFVLKTVSQGWRNDICCSSRRPAFSSQNLQGGSQLSANSSPNGSSTFFRPPQVPGTHLIYWCTCRHDTPIHIKNKLKKEILTQMDKRPRCQR